MADDRALRCKNLKINDEDFTIVDLFETKLQETNDRVSLNLVGRLLTDWTFNIEAFKRTMHDSILGTDSQEDYY